MHQPRTKKNPTNLMEDDGFKSVFANPDFEVDKTADEYRLINPVVSKLEKNKTKKLEAIFAPVKDEELEGKGSSDEDESSSDDDREIAKRDKKQLRKQQREADASVQIKPKFYEIKPGEDFKHSDLNATGRNKLSKVSLGERMSREGDSEIRARGPLGSREMSFKLRNSKSKDFREDARKHHEERRKVRRSAGGLRSKKNAWKK